MTSSPTVPGAPAAPSWLLPTLSGAVPIVLPCPEEPEVSVVVLAWRQTELLAACLRSLAEHRTDVAFEAVVVLNGATPDVRNLVGSHVRGALVVDSAQNLGFAGGNNRGVRAARGDLLVLLNDDAELLPGFLDRIVRTARDEPRAGAVGSCVLFPDGRVQEAGGVVWADGTTAVLDRGRDPVTAAIRGRRPVDYVSGCAVLVRRSTWEAVGGLDDGYYPAYYEDADLCLAIRERGDEVLVEPTAMVVHHESASTTSLRKTMLFRRNVRRFRGKWAEVLATLPSPRLVTPAVIERRAAGAPRRGHHVLVVDDRAPTPAGGSGFPRMVDGLRAILSLPDVRVSFAPGTTRATDAEVELASHGVRVVDEPLHDHLADPRHRYDVVVVSRPNNWAECVPLVETNLPEARLVYDAEALYHRRLRLQAELTPDPEVRADVLALAEHYERIERDIARRAHRVVTLSVDEAAWLRAAGSTSVTLVPPDLHGISRGPVDVDRRAGALFVAGWMAGATSPNADGLRWYREEVHDRIRDAHRWYTLAVTGADPPPEVLALRAPGLEFVGSLPDLAAAYATSRVAIAPVRYGAGVKLKIVEALQHGVPAVTTTVGAEGFAPEWRSVLCVGDDPAAFAEHVDGLVADRRRWAEQRLRIEAMLEEWSTRDHPTLGDVVAELLEVDAGRPTTVGRSTPPGAARP